MTDENSAELLALTADIVAAHVSNNRVATQEVSDLIAQVHAALTGLSTPKVVQEAEPQPAVPVRSSVKHDYIVCLEDGKKLKMLKRYLRTNYNMSPEEYRTKWKLPRDYPMVAPAYAEQRRGLARAIGLGRKKDGTAAKPAAAAKTATKPESKTAKPAAAKPAAAPKAAKAPAPKAAAPKAAKVTKPKADAAATKAAPKPRGRPKKVAATAA